MAEQSRNSDGSVSKDQGVFMISVAAELAGTHPQTLRVYEARGLIKPQRSPKGTRLYSQQDVETLRRIHELTTQLGLSLAGVERVLALEQAMAEMQARVHDMQREMLEQVAAVHRSYKRELVPWQPPSRLSPQRNRRSSGGANAAR